MSLFFWLSLKKHCPLHSFSSIVADGSMLTMSEKSRVLSRGPTPVFFLKFSRNKKNNTKKCPKKIRALRARFFTRIDRLYTKNTSKNTILARRRRKIWTILLLFVIFPLLFSWFSKKTENSPKNILGRPKKKSPT